MTGSGDFSIGSKVWPGTSKLLEEMGELQQVLGKLQQTLGKLIQVAGSTLHWDGDLRPKMIEELGDVAGAIAFFVEKNLTVTEECAVGDRAEQKMALFREWHDTGDTRPRVEEPSDRCAERSPMGNRCDQPMGHLGPCRATDGKHVEDWENT
jgi:NTP pyrophosphatase (non-canonical NTP hydrolase)